jgi:hypothetical protein
MMVLSPRIQSAPNQGSAREGSKFIRNRFATGAVGGGGKIFDGFRPIQTFLNDRVADCFYPGQRELL